MAKKSLLIVDSDARSQRLLEVSLRKAGFSITTATNGLDALEKVNISVPDLIISDTKLAEVDGFEFCRRIKADAKLEDIPFIFLTAQKSIEHKIKGLELGVDDYLTKPIYMKEVITRVRILIEKRDKEALERRDRSGFGGHLGDMGVVDLLQTVELGRKTGVLHLENKSQAGDIWFRNGKIVDGEIGRLRGDKAIYRFLVWNDGIFSIDFDEHDRPDAIELSTQGLLMEGMRRLDEWGRLLEQLPPLDNRFDIDYREFASRLAEIPDEVNSILRLFDGRRTLMDIMDVSEFGDLEALNIISKLYFEGLIHDVSSDDHASADGADPSVDRWLDQPLPEKQPEPESEPQAVHPPAPALETREPASSEQLTPSPVPQQDTTPDAPPGRATTEPQFGLQASTPPQEPQAGAEPPTGDRPADDLQENASVSSWLEQPLPAAASQQASHQASERPAGAADPALAAADVDVSASEADDWEDVEAPPNEESNEIDGEETISLVGDDEDSLEQALNRELQSAHLHEPPVELRTRRDPPSEAPSVREPAHMDSGELAQQLVAEALAAVDEAADATAIESEPAASLTLSGSDADPAPPETPPHAFSPPQVVQTPAEAEGSPASSQKSQAAILEAISQEIPDEGDIVEEAHAPSTPSMDGAAHISEEQFFDSAENQGPAAGGRALSTPSFGNEELPPLLPTAPAGDHAPPARRSTVGLVLGALALFVVGGGAGIILVSNPKTLGSRLLGDEDPATSLADAASGSARPDAARTATPSTKQPVTDAAAAPKAHTGAGPVADAARGEAPTDAGPKPDPIPTPTAADTVAPAPKTPTPKTYEHYIRRGRSLAERGRLRPAIAAFRKALDLNKRSPEAQTALANAYYELDELGSAERHLKKAVKIAPRYAPAYVLLGTVYQSMGRNNEAITAYDRYLVLAPQGPFAKDVRDVVSRLKAEKE